MGAKILNRPHDLVLAERITDGCVVLPPSITLIDVKWAYNITATGVMSESFSVDVCYDMPCHWTPRSTQVSGQDDSPANTRPPPENLPPLAPLNQNDHDRGALPVVQPQPGAGPGHHHVKRAPEPEPQQQQHQPQQRQQQQPQQHQPQQPQQPQRPGSQGDESRQGPPVQEAPDPEDIVEPVQVTKLEVDPSVQQQAADRLQATREQKKINRPASFRDGMDTRYILRPEAIESVFYMWRITGDPKWQDKGWQMWESIEKVSWTELAYSAIMDVNDVNSTKSDSMERYVPTSLSVLCLLMWVVSFWRRR